MNFEAPLLPTINAFLNFSSAFFLISGFFSIRKGKRKLHQICMLIAFLLSSLFLVLYIIYHWQVGAVPFQGKGKIRFFYFSILSSHTLLALFTLPLALVTLFQAFKGAWLKHRKVARLTLPIWLYVSLTGVLVYLMLYQLSFS